MDTQRAVVIGSGIAGLLTARVLADRFVEVVVVERDPEGVMAGPRQGAAQGWHLHGLLASGLQAMGRLFPNFEADLAAADARMGADAGIGVKLFYDGRWAPAVTAGFNGVAVTRPTLECCLRKRVAALPNVRFVYQTVASDLLFAERRVTGVRMRRIAEDDREEDLSADLVVDASGRAAQGAAMVKAQGFPTPEEEVIGLDFGYACALYDIPEGFEADWSALMVAAAPPASQGAILMPVEGNRWMLGVGGRGAERPPGDEAALLEHLKRLP
ncbi:MAG TPA: FAD-binding protein, partial [Phenylobacterium sp.]|nr:FAD-binding protein [Phenylobacterium sp.]